MAEKRWPKTEHEMGQGMLAWLKAKNPKAVIHSEVAIAGRVADWVVRSPKGELWVIEAKLQLSLDLLAQCMHWLPHAAHVSALVPAGKATDGRILARQLFPAHGVGLLEILHPGRVFHARPEKPNPAHNSAPLLAALHPEQQSYEAGKPSPKRWTPFKRTIEGLQAFADAAGGTCELREALHSLDHVWKTRDVTPAKLRKAALAGQLEGFARGELVGGRVILTRTGEKG